MVKKLVVRRGKIKSDAKRNLRKERPAAPGVAGRRLRVALDHLAAVDRDFAAALAMVGPPPPRGMEDGFVGLLHLLVDQQISVHAARRIWERLTERLPLLTPRRFLKLSEPELRRIGFSRQKVRYSRNLAKAMIAGRFDPATLPGLADDEAIAALTALDGIGLWTAEVYLLFALGRPDVMPAGDLALLVAAGRLKSLPARPTPKELRVIAEGWRPWRSVAARFLWHYYRHAPAASSE